MNALRQDIDLEGGGVGDEDGDVGRATRRPPHARALEQLKLLYSGLLPKEHSLHRLERLHQLLLRRQ